MGATVSVSTGRCGGFDQAPTAAVSRPFENNGSVTFRGAERSSRLAKEVYKRMPAKHALLHVLSTDTGSLAFRKFLADNFSEENLWFYMVRNLFISHFIHFLCYILVINVIYNILYLALMIFI